MARPSAPWHYFYPGSKSKDWSKLCCTHSTGTDDSLFSRIAGFGETFDWLAMSQRGTSGSLLVTPSETACVRPRLDEPVTPNKQIIVDQSDEEPEQ